MTNGWLVGGRAVVIGTEVDLSVSSTLPLNIVYKTGIAEAALRAILVAWHISTITMHTYETLA